jgi:hypothetical protein
VVKEVNVLSILSKTLNNLMQAIVIGNGHPEYEKHVKAVHAIFFFATPHQGTAVANRVILMANILRFVPGVKFFLPSLKALKDLRINGEASTVLSDRFRPRLSALETVSFYELDKTKVIPLLGCLSPKISVSVHRRTCQI